MNEIVLGTSLAPFNFEKQMAAVESWIKNGFRVFSCNTKTEIEILEKYFKNINVEFVEITHDASNIVGKPLPFIQDILNIVSKRTKSICGYINSDIIISDMPDGMYEFIEAEAENSFVFVRRNEISNIDDICDLNWKIHFDGIDMFLLDKKLVDNFFDDGFFVQSVWDLCILIKAVILGIKIKELINPIAFHMNHPLKWNFETSNFLVTEFYYKYFKEKDNSYKKALDCYYNILFEKSEQICFYKSKNYRCLFVLDSKDVRTTESIKEQDYNNIEIAEHVKKDVKYDYLFFAKKGVIYNKVFCRTVMYVMEQFDCKHIEADSFFVSLIEDRFRYNELNRNISLIEQINKKDNLSTMVLRQASEGKERALHYPVSYEEIDINDRRTVEYRKLQGQAYLMPSGIRASEWYHLNKYKLHDLQIIGYLDNNSEKNGTDQFGMKVYSVEQLKQTNEDVYVIVASKRYSEEIIHQLSEMISPDRILNASLMLYIDDEGVFYFRGEQSDRNKD